MVTVSVDCSVLERIAKIMSYLRLDSSGKVMKKKRKDKDVKGLLPSSAAEVLEGVPTAAVGLISATSFMISATSFKEVSTFEVWQEMNLGLWDSSTTLSIVLEVCSLANPGDLPPPVQVQVIACLPTVLQLLLNSAYKLYILDPHQSIVLNSCHKQVGLMLMNEKLGSMKPRFKTRIIMVHFGGLHPTEEIVLPTKLMVDHRLYRELIWEYNRDVHTSRLSGGAVKLPRTTNGSPEADFHGELIRSLTFVQRVPSTELGAALVNKESSDVHTKSYEDVSREERKHCLKVTLEDEPDAGCSKAFSDLDLNHLSRNACNSCYRGPLSKTMSRYKVHNRPSETRYWSRKPERIVSLDETRLCNKSLQSNDYDQGLRKYHTPSGTTSSKFNRGSDIDGKSWTDDARSSRREQQSKDTQPLVNVSGRVFLVYCLLAETDVSHEQYSVPVGRVSRSLMKQIEALNVKARRVQAQKVAAQVGCDEKGKCTEVANGRDSSSGITSYDAQSAKMKERARQRANELQVEEEERKRTQKARAMVKLEELNMRRNNRDMPDRSKEQQVHHSYAKGSINKGNLIDACDQRPRIYGAQLSETAFSQSRRGTDVGRKLPMFDARSNRRPSGKPTVGVGALPGSMPTRSRSIWIEKNSGEKVVDQTPRTRTAWDEKTMVGRSAPILPPQTTKSVWIQKRRNM